MYHYYTSKEALFLLCVEHTFRALAQYLESRRAALEQQDAEQAIQLYFSARELFFREHERERTVFESAMLRTPVPLREDIARLRAPVAAQNRACLLYTSAARPQRESAHCHHALVAAYRRPAAGGHGAEKQPAGRAAGPCP